MESGLVAIGEVFREARRRAGLTQLQVARHVGCTQSAVSMFEAGRSDAVSTETQRKIAELLGIDPNILSAEQLGTTRRGALTLKFCPIAHCPSNIPYVVNDRLCFRPTMIEGVKGAREWCPSCGEILEESCPNEKCGSDVFEGAFCRKCGSPYLQGTNVATENPCEWADSQRAKIREIRVLSLRERFWNQNRGIWRDVVFR
ncbi:MAG: helix-turn-helix domain-containing protein [Kiritimatiellae bacterium]|nr:helix-turn-helix domain-containing protein [Kiritimatiellia bacterium]